MLLGVKAAGAYGWQPTTITVPLSWRLGALTLLDPSGPSWSVWGRLYLLTYSFLLLHFSSKDWWIISSTEHVFIIHIWQMDKFHFICPICRHDLYSELIKYVILFAWGVMLTYFLDHRTIECTKILADKFMGRKYYSYLKLKFVKHDFLVAATPNFWNWQHHSFTFFCVSSMRAYSKSLHEFVTPEICLNRISYAICDRKSFHFRNNHVYKHSSSVVSVVRYPVFIFASTLGRFAVYTYNRNIYSTLTDKPTN